MAAFTLAPLSNHVAKSYSTINPFFKSGDSKFMNKISVTYSKKQCQGGGNSHFMRATCKAQLTRELFSPLNVTEPLVKDNGGLTTSTSKVTVVGVGNVGMACAQTILTEDLADELALVDVNPDKLRGEMLDLQHAAAFLPRVKITASTDYESTAGSDICVVTAGARQREGESRLSLLDRNVALFGKIIPELVRWSPGALLLIVANPVDILTAIAWRLSGLPPNRIIGSGTNLDSSRLRFLIAERFNVNAHNIHGFMVGEHGDSSVPLWSSLTVANMPILQLPCDSDKKNLYTKEKLDEEFHSAVVGSAYEVIKLKGYTSWAIGYSVASLVQTLLRDQRRIHPVSVLAKGFYGISEEVFLSLPTQLGRAGVLGVASLPIDVHEREQLHGSARTLWETQQKLSL